MEITGVHPAAEELPLLEGDQLAELAADIAEHGLQHPVVVDSSGLLIDGRNRKAACEIAGVKLKTSVLPEGTDPISYIISVNIFRRHLTVGQKALMVAALVNYPQGTNQFTSSNVKKTDPAAMTAEKAAEKAGVSVTSVYIAKKLLKSGDKEMIERVKSGSATLHQAKSVIPRKMRNPFDLPPLPPAASVPVKQPDYKSVANGSYPFLQFLREFRDRRSACQLAHDATEANQSGDSAWVEEQKATMEQVIRAAQACLDVLSDSEALAEAAASGASFDYWYSRHVEES